MIKRVKKLLGILKKPNVSKTLLGIAIAVVIIAAYIYIEKTTGRVFIENAQVSAPIVNISSLNPGKLVEVYTSEGKLVKKGDPLAVVGTDTIRADTDGLIIMTNKQIGATLTVQNPIVQMIDTSNFRIVGTLDENKGLAKIKVGQVVSFTIDALAGKTFWGYIDGVSPTAKQTQLSFSISSERPTQQFEVYARFNAYAYPEIKNGMSAKMTVFTEMP